jgi:hypothetical protein
MARLAAHEAVLRTSGAVQLRREPGRARSYRLRVRVMDAERGHRRQLSIAVGDAVAAAAVNAVLQEWRVAHDERQAADAAAVRRAADRAERRWLRSHAQDLGGGGRRRRRETGRLFDRVASAGGLDAWAFWACREFRRPDRLPGRRRKGGLTLGDG